MAITKPWMYRVLSWTAMTVVQLCPILLVGTDVLFSVMCHQCAWPVRQVMVSQVPTHN